LTRRRKQVHNARHARAEVARSVSADCTQARLWAVPAESAEKGPTDSRRFWSLCVADGPHIPILERQTRAAPHPAARRPVQRQEGHQRGVQLADKRLPHNCWFSPARLGAQLTSRASCGSAALQRSDPDLAALVLEHLEQPL